jgi:hypothetical protein
MQAGARSPRAVRELQRSPLFQGLVRAGFVARALTYGVVGGLALALAMGAGTDGTAPNQQGALALLAQSTPGKLALVVAAVGLLAYAVWKLAQGFLGYGPEGGGGRGAKDRISNFAGGVMYVGFFVVCVRVLFGSAGNSRTAPRHAAAGVLGWPGGPVIVGLAGVVMMAVGLYQIYDAVTAGFAADSKTSRMGPDERRLFLFVGRIGLSARSVVFVLVGYFVLRAALQFDPKTAVGIDGALERLRHQTLGPWLLGLVALGLLVFALFSTFEARYRRL